MLATAIVLLLLAPADAAPPCEGSSVRVEIPNPPKGKTAPPAVTITDAKGRVHEPAPQSSPLCFRGVPAGKATLKLSGDRWLTVEQPIEVKPGSTHDVTAVVTTKLVVNWWTPNNLAELAKARPACDDEAALNEPVAATLLICSNRDPEATFMPGQSKNCSATEPRMLSVDEPQGTLTFENVPRGKHILRFTAGGLPPLEKEVRVFENETTVEQVEARWATVYGKVTKGGKPVHAKVFETAVTDPESGAYIAAFTRLPGAQPMRVKPCDGSAMYFHVPEDAPKENAAFDIEIPNNRVVVEVVDAATGKPVEKAGVSYAAPIKGSERGAQFSMSAGKTDEKGRVTITTLLPKKTLRICAMHAEYDFACTDDFEIAETEEKQLRVALSKVVLRDGRVHAPGVSTIVWSGSAGETERVRTNAEGRFKYKKPHGVGEIVTVSTAAGFFAVPQPPLEEGQAFEIAVPAGPRRTFEVTLASTARDAAMFTIALGDLVVPHDGFSQHLIQREQQPALRPGSTTVVHDVIETGPISVIVAPLSFLRSTSSPRGWVFLPEARSLPRKALGDQTKLLFE